MFRIYFEILQGIPKQTIYRSLCSFLGYVMSVPIFFSDVNFQITIVCIVFYFYQFSVHVLILDHVMFVYISSFPCMCLFLDYVMFVDIYMFSVLNY